VTSLAPSVDVRRAAERFASKSERLDAWYSFAFGDFYDPTNTDFGLLVAFNEFVVAEGAGFASHPHRDMEIVTWVLEGRLTHQDSAGNRGVVVPGVVQRLSAGSGVVHSEANDVLHPGGRAQRVRFVQMWVVPDQPGLPPSYEQRAVDDALASGRLVPVASGMAGHDAAVGISQQDAALHVARLAPGQSIQLPDAPYVHLFVAGGAATLERTGALATGDAVRLTGTGGQQVSATEPAELLVWEMRADRATPRE
jgi:redox-sensitive bicupin YhaK (pirin superfamily)